MRQPLAAAPAAGVETPDDALVRVGDQEDVAVELRQARPVPRTRSFADDSPGSLRLGQRVRHQKFGDGVVLSVEGQGSNARVQVNFERQGTKWLMMGYANLQVV